MYSYDSASALWPFSAGTVLSPTPIRLMHLPNASVVADVPVADLAKLAAGPDAALRLWARRDFLGDTSVNRELREILRLRSVEFGAVGTIVMGADNVQMSVGPEAGRSFGGALHVYGVECIDGFQRLRIIAEELAAAEDPDLLSQATMRVEIYCGPSRDLKRRLHDAAGGLVNAPTAQDGLLRCPNIGRLVVADWEGMGSFHPQRGVRVEPQGDALTMETVTRALACLSDAAVPRAAFLAATDDGLQRFWGSLGSPLYLSVFHDRMIPLGVKRAVEAWEQVRGTLRDTRPKRKKNRRRTLD